MLRLLSRLLPALHPAPVFELTNSEAILPTRGTKHSAGLDIYASMDNNIGPGRTVIIKTGLKCKFNRGWGAFLWDRSGMGYKGVHRFAGVIDSDYKSFWGVILHNSTRDWICIEAGDRIAQVVFQRVWIGTPKTGTVSQTGERTGGFGSTGV